MKSPLIFFILLMSCAFSAQAEPIANCGETGTVEQRVTHCGFRHTDSSKQPWDLVSRIFYPQRNMTYQVWRETRFGILWTQVFASSQENAMLICQNNFPHRVNAQIPGLWKVATAEDYRHVVAVDVLHQLLGGEFFGERYWTDRVSATVDVKTWSVVTDSPANSFPVLCRTAR